MNREIINTGDGSHTVQIKELNVTYHSKHGAIQESMHVFIEAGLHHYIEASGKEEIHIFEMGFGTGLNALLTAAEAEKFKKNIVYTAIELHPLEPAENKNLNYASLLSSQTTFEKIHAAPWDREVRITEYFVLHKINSNLLGYCSQKRFDIVYYDAFAPTAQPELWTVDVFKTLFAQINAGGVLVTYCSKGDVRRAMQAAGFVVEKIPGPPGKREMVRAVRPSSDSTR